MKLRQGKTVFFIYDLKENKIINRGIVAHGSGSETEIKGKLKFSNIPKMTIHLNTILFFTIIMMFHIKRKMVTFAIVMAVQWLVENTSNELPK